MNDRIIDHIVYAVPNLEEGITRFTELTGVEPVFGGYHTTKGTKNGLVRLGDNCYLEILAVDHENKKVTPPRWMGVDLINVPQITRWSLKSDNLKVDSEVLKAYHPDMGGIQGGERKTATDDWLRWQMILPLANPLVEVIPFFTDWKDSSLHPTDKLAPLCSLVSLQLEHPQPDKPQLVMNRLGSKVKIKKGDTARITVTISAAGKLITL